MKTQASDFKLTDTARPESIALKDDYDVIVVGAGPGGCTTALSFAEKGLRVALLERKHDIDAYKPVCTHYIQGCATSVLQKLGLANYLEHAGALRNSIDIWTCYGWIKPWDKQESPHYGYNVRRQTLDPILRKRAAAHPRIDLLLGHQPVRLIKQGNVVNGLTVDIGLGQERDVRARLTVGADGRGSVMARLAQAKEKVLENRRNFFVTYYKDLCKDDTRSKIWFADKDIAYAFPCDGGMLLLCLGIHESNSHLYENNLEQSFHDYFKSLSDPPDMDKGTRVARITQGKKMHTIRRHHSLQGFTLVGDAFLSSDPFPGVGIGWAIQGGDWLADFTADLLKQGKTAHAQVRRYERHHVRKLMGHVWVISSYSSGRKWSRVFPPEKLLLEAAVTCQDTAKVLDLYLNRIAGLTSLIMPRVLIGALYEKIRQFLRRRLNFRVKVSS